MLIDTNSILEAKKIDLLTYLQTYEPQELVHVSGNTYCTREHDSLKISNGKWYWFSRDIGGSNALNYLIKVKGYTFIQAVETILGRTVICPPTYHIQEIKDNKDLILPKLMDKPIRAATYLKGRGIHQTVIDYCIEKKLLFESANYHNAIFVGYDKQGVPRYGAVRSIFSGYKGELTGSNKHFSFSLPGNSSAQHLHVFESAIDLLSFATLELFEGKDWKQDAMLSLAGVFKTKRENVVPVALAQFLSDHPNITTIHLHLDNDDIGRNAVSGIVSGLQKRYQVYDEPPAFGKDVNEMLCRKVGLKDQER